MLYAPGVRPASVYVPSAVDLAVRTKPLVVDTALISALEIVAPLLSVTRPRIVAVVDDCARALPAMSSANNHAGNVRLMVFLLLCWNSSGRRGWWRCTRASRARTDARAPRAARRMRASRARRCPRE